jgi:murein DD-endopeptidase MepM/ murein hydrolase activator NlpD
MSATRILVRMATVAALVVAAPVGATGAGLAQVDPCVPVPVPELCDVVEPSPSPDPSPSANADNGAQADKGQGASAKADKSDGQQQGRKDAGKKGAKGKKAQGATTPRGTLTVSSPNNSATLIDTLSPLSRYGLHLHEALLRVVGPFPVAGLSYWTDDWHACRDGCTRFHEGLDIFGKEGTPLVATADGVVTQKLVGELSGISIEIQDANGIQYFYAHMSAWAEPIQVGDAVHVGQVLGYLGHTGNALYTPPHLHFELQPGGVPVPPKPFVDRWVKIAELEARALAARIMDKEAPQASDFRLTRLFDLAGGAEILDPGAERLLALAGIQPSVSSLEMARRLLGQMSWEIDWAGQTDAQIASLSQQATAVTSAQDLSGATPWAPFGTAPTGAQSSGSGIPEQGD